MASYYKDIFTEQRWNCQVKKTLNIKKTLCKFNEFLKKKFIYRLNDMFNFGGKLVLQKPIIADSKSSIPLIYSRV